MEARTMREKLKEAKGIYYMDDFRVFIRKLQGMTDEDFKKPAPRINDKILNSEETDSKEIQNKPDMKFHQKRKEGRNG